MEDNNSDDRINDLECVKTVSANFLIKVKGGNYVELV
jgi:hypothetical protein